MHERIFELFRHRLRRFYTTEYFKMYPESIPLEGMCAVTKEPVPFRDRLKLSYSPVKKGDIWGHEWDNDWFHFTVTVPKSFEGLRFAQEVKRVSETNLLEWEHGRELQMNERTVSLKMKPFEIVTLRIE